MIIMCNSRAEMLEWVYDLEAAIKEAHFALGNENTSVDKQGEPKSIVPDLTLLQERVSELEEQLERVEKARDGLIKLKGFYDSKKDPIVSLIRKISYYYYYYYVVVVFVVVLLLLLLLLLLFLFLLLFLPKKKKLKSNKLNQISLTTTNQKVCSRSCRFTES